MMKTLLVPLLSLMFCTALHVHAQDQPSTGSGVNAIATELEAVRDKAEKLLEKYGVSLDHIQPQAQDEPEPVGPIRTAVEKRIRAGIDAFISAFNAHDAAAVAALWSPSGTYTSASGEEYVGRVAIEQAYAELFDASPRASCAVEMLGLQIVNPSTVIEHGHTTVYADTNAPPATGRYVATHVRQGTEWVMVSVQDLPDTVLDQRAAFRDLGWLIGSWHSQISNLALTTEFTWIGDGAFLQRRWTSRLRERQIAEGIQIIGWDPVSQGVSSWSFDSRGSYSSAAWTPDESGWSIAADGVLADGTAFAANYTMASVDDDTLTIASHDRMIGDVELPELPGMTLRRVAQDD
jgi:uncharacterized protein (TIGR02246 family)